MARFDACGDLRLRPQRQVSGECPIELLTLLANCYSLTLAPQPVKHGRWSVQCVLLAPSRLIRHAAATRLRL